MPWCFGAFGSVRVEQEAVVGVVTLGRPHLLTVDHPLVAVEHGRRRQAGEVRPRVRLARSPGTNASRRAGSRAGTPSSAPRSPTAGSSDRRACRRRSRRASGPCTRANSSASTTPCIVESPLPPYSSGHVAQIQPPSWSRFGQLALNSARSSSLSSNVSPRSTASTQPAGRLSRNQSRISWRNASASASYVSSTASSPSPSPSPHHAGRPTGHRHRGRRSGPGNAPVDTLRR